MEQPDVLAMELEEAISVCKSSGWEIEINLTRPPGSRPAGPLRVIRFTRVNRNKAVLTVASEDRGKEQPDRC